MSLSKISLCVSLRVFRAIPASALNEDEDEDDDGISGDERDDERSGTRYNVGISLSPWFIRNLLTDSTHLTVLLVPCDIRHRCDVRCDASYGLVRLSPSSWSIYELTA